jgi:NAD(P)H-hydrate epimerase
MGLFESLSGEVIECVERPKPVKTGIKEADLIVDAIFGTGLSKPVGGMEKTVIDEINASGKPVIAVDIPSGIDGATGKALGSAVHALHTFTYAYPKLGQVLSPGGDHCGRLTVIDISIPSFLERQVGFDGEITDGDMIRAFSENVPPGRTRGASATLWSWQVRRGRRGRPTWHRSLP